jgi:hypothetical protein
VSPACRHRRPAWCGSRRSRRSGVGAPGEWRAGTTLPGGPTEQRGSDRGPGRGSARRVHLRAVCAARVVGVPFPP